MLSHVGVALACIGVALFEVGVARATPKVYKSPPLDTYVRADHTVPLTHSRNFPQATNRQVHFRRSPVVIGNFPCFGETVSEAPNSIDLTHFYVRCSAELHRRGRFISRNDRPPKSTDTRTTLQTSFSFCLRHKGDLRLDLCWSKHFAVTPVDLCYLTATARSPKATVEWLMLQSKDALMLNEELQNHHC